MKGWLFCASALTATATLLPSASAQPGHPSVIQTGLSGATHVNVAGLEQGVGLKEFQLAFQNGDHKLASIGVMPAPGRLEVVFKDKDGYDPFQLEARYVRLTTRQSKTVTKSCGGGTCTVSIEKASPTDTFVLQGFKLTRKSGDSNVREIGLRPNGIAGTVDFVFRDNGTFPYDVELRYAYAPRGSFNGTGTVTRRFDGKSAVRPSGGLLAEAPGSTGMAIIQGFNFRFENGDHHVRTIWASDVTSFSPRDGSTGRTQFEVAFFDANRDDPWTATIDYAAMKNSTWFRAP